MPIARTLLVAALVTQASVLATTVYLHRVLAHRSLTLQPSLTLAFRAVLWITTGITPRAWVAVHRKHHAFSDTPQDPHSPVVLGFWAVQLGNVKLYRHTIRDGVTVTRYSRDLPPDGLDDREVLPVEEDRMDEAHVVAAAFAPLGLGGGLPGAVGVAGAVPGAHRHGAPDGRLVEGAEAQRHVDVGVAVPGEGLLHTA